MFDDDEADLLDNGLAEFTNYELMIDYKTVARADSGIYLKAVPQVQIWDSTDESKFRIGADKGSGGLWNNSKGAKGKRSYKRCCCLLGNEIIFSAHESEINMWAY